MNQAIGLTATQFGFGAGVFFVGYCLLEIPSNLALYRVGARRLAVADHDFVGAGVGGDGASRSGPTASTRCGCCSASPKPASSRASRSTSGRGFPSQYRTRMIAWFMVAIPVSSVIGGPISGWLLGLDGVGGLAGWQWMFLARGPAGRVRRPGPAVAAGRSSRGCDVAHRRGAPHRPRPARRASSGRARCGTSRWPFAISA